MDSRNRGMNTAYKQHADEINRKILADFDKKAKSITKCDGCNGTRRIATPFGMAECPLH